MKSRRLYPILAITGAFFFTLALIGSFFQGNEKAINDREKNVNRQVQTVFSTLRSIAADPGFLGMLDDIDQDHSLQIEQFLQQKLPVSEESSIYVWKDGELTYWDIGLYGMFLEIAPKVDYTDILYREDQAFVKWTLSPVSPGVETSSLPGIQFVIPIRDLQSIAVNHSADELDSNLIPLEGLKEYLKKESSGTKANFILMIYLFGYVFLLAYLFLMAHQLARIYNSLRILIGLLLVIVLLRTVGYFFPLSHPLAGDFFKPGFFSETIPGSMADWLLNVVIGFLFALFFYVHTPEAIRNQSLKRKRLLTFLAYLIFGLCTILFCFFVKSVVENQYILLDINIVENFTSGSLVLMFACFLLLLSLFIVSIKLFLMIQAFELGWLERIGIFLVALLACALVLHWSSLQLNTGLWIVSLLIIMLLFDLFLDSSMRDFTWISVWLLILSLFTTVLFSHFYTAELTRRSVEALADKLSIPDTHLIAAIRDVNTRLHSAKENQPGLESFLNDVIFSNPGIRNIYQFSVSRIPQHLEKESYQGIDFYFQKTWPGRYYFPTGSQKSMGIQVDGVGTEIVHRNSNDHYSSYVLFNTGDWTLYDNGIITNDESLFFPPTLDSLSVRQARDSQFVRDNTIYTMVERGNAAALGRQDYDGLLQPMSFFSFNFILSLLIFGLLLLIHRAVPFLPRELHQYFIENLSIRNKIQFSVLAILIAAFTMVGIVSANFYKRSYKETLESTVKEYYQKVKRADFGNEEILKVFDGIPGKFILFDQNGKAIENRANHEYTHLPYPVVRKVKLSNTLDQFDAIWQGALVLPFSLDQDRTVFLAYPQLTEVPDGFYRFINLLLNAFVFLLLISSALSFSISNTIISPLTELGNKLKEFSLGKHNDPIPWKQPDELGTLIQSYNEMVEKLEQSAELLAHSEREVAWREMAKQVAHEIKNPLTPMKLSIQHMEFRIREAKEDEAREIVRHVSKVIIEQIDNLSRIASEFSSFANLPKPEYEEIMLNDLVASVYDLFRTRSNIKFNLYVPIDELVVQADRTHLIRVMNNLMKNAVQAIPPDREGHIVIRLLEKDGLAVVRVEDNGKGIEDDLHEKVFFPNFTTKSSGTGLGLAISKNIIETFDGAIYFIKNKPEGTIFIFELPLVN